MEKELQVIGPKNLFVKASGTMYLEDAVLLKQRVFEMMEKGYCYIIADLSEVDYIDSFGLGVLVRIQREAEKHQGHFVVESYHPSLETLFNLTSLTKIPVY